MFRRAQEPEKKEKDILEKEEPVEATDTLEEKVPIETEEQRRNRKRAEQVRDAYKGLQNSVQQFLLAAFRITLSQDELIELCNKIRAVINSFVSDTSENRLKKILGDLCMTSEEKAKQK